MAFNTATTENPFVFASSPTHNDEPFIKSEDAASFNKPTLSQQRNIFADAGLQSTSPPAPRASTATPHQTIGNVQRTNMQCLFPQFYFPPAASGYFAYYPPPAPYSSTGTALPPAATSAFPLSSLPPMTPGVSFATPSAATSATGPPISWFDPLTPTSAATLPAAPSTPTIQTLPQYVPPTAITTPAVNMQYATPPQQPTTPDVAAVRPQHDPMTTTSPPHHAQLSDRMSTCTPPPRPPQLPPLDRANPLTWFAAVEALFKLHHIESDEDRFLCLVTSIYSHTDLAGDFLLHRPAPPMFDNAKEILLRRLSHTPERALTSIIETETLGTRTPSQLWRLLRAQVSDAFLSDAALWTLWQQKLPEELPLHLLAIADKPLEERLTYADEAYEMLRARRNNFRPAAAPALQSSVASVVTPTSPHLSSIRAARNKLERTVETPVDGSLELRPPTLPPTTATSLTGAPPVAQATQLTDTEPADFLSAAYECARLSTELANLLIDVARNDNTNMSHHNDALRSRLQSITDGLLQLSARALTLTTAAAPLTQQATLAAISPTPLYPSNSCSRSNTPQRTVEPSVDGVPELPPSSPPPTTPVQLAAPHQPPQRCVSSVAHVSTHASGSPALARVTFTPTSQQTTLPPHPLCWYHTTHGDKARRCCAPCSATSTRTHRKRRRRRPRTTDLQYDVDAANQSPDTNNTIQTRLPRVFVNKDPATHGNAFLPPPADSPNVTTPAAVDGSSTPTSINIPIARLSGLPPADSRSAHPSCHTSSREVPVTLTPRDNTRCLSDCVASSPSPRTVTPRTRSPHNIHDAPQSARPTIAALTAPPTWSCPARQLTPHLST